MKIYYCVEVPLPGPDERFWPICRVLDVDHVAEVVRVLLRCGQTGPQIVRVRVEIVD